MDSNVNVMHNGGKEQDCNHQKVYVVMIKYPYEGELLDCVFADQARAEQYCAKNNKKSVGRYYIAKKEVIE